MNRAEHGTGDHRSQNRIPKALPEHTCLRLRKRRYHVSRQASGLDWSQWHSIPDYVIAAPEPPLLPAAPIEQAQTAPPKAPKPTTPTSAAAMAEVELMRESERISILCRKAFWTCVVAFQLILFCPWIIMLVDEAARMWPG